MDTLTQALIAAFAKELDATSDRYDAAKEAHHQKQAAMEAKSRERAAAIDRTVDEILDIVGRVRDASASEETRRRLSFIHKGWHSRPTDLSTWCRHIRNGGHDGELGLLSISNIRNSEYSIYIGGNVGVNVKSIDRAAPILAMVLIRAAMRSWRLVDGQPRYVGPIYGDDKQVAKVDLQEAAAAIEALNQGAQP